MTHDDDEMNDEEFDRKAILLMLPLQTHIDMVALTLNNLEMKLGALGILDEAQNTLSVKDVELLRRLSERLMMQRERIERALNAQPSLRGIQYHSRHDRPCGGHP